MAKFASFLLVLVLCSVSCHLLRKPVKVQQHALKAQRFAGAKYPVLETTSNGKHSPTFKVSQKHATTAPCAGLFVGGKAPTLSSASELDETCVLGTDAVYYAGYDVGAKHPGFVATLVKKDKFGSGDRPAWPVADTGKAAVFDPANFVYFKKDAKWYPIYSTNPLVSLKTRGHLIANDYFQGGPANQAATFSYYNCVPTFSEFESGKGWGDMEKAVKTFADGQTEGIHLVVAPGKPYPNIRLASPAQQTKIGGQAPKEDKAEFIYRKDDTAVAETELIPVPASVWAAVYDPVGDRAVAYECTNGNDGEAEPSAKTTFETTKFTTDAKNKGLDQLLYKDTIARSALGIAKAKDVKCSYHSVNDMQHATGVAPFPSLDKDKKKATDGSWLKKL